MRIRPAEHRQAGSQLCNRRYNPVALIGAIPLEFRRFGPPQSGMMVALYWCVRRQRKYEVGCKVGLACGAGLHWIGAVLLLSDHLATSSTWEYAPGALHLIASSLLQRLLQI